MCYSWQELELVISFKLKFHLSNLKTLSKVSCKNFVTTIEVHICVRTKIPENVTILCLSLLRKHLKQFTSLNYWDRMYSPIVRNTHIWSRILSIFKKRKISKCSVSEGSWKTYFQKNYVTNFNENWLMFR